MDFNLFGNKKDSEEIKQAQDIKSATKSDNEEQVNNFNPNFEQENNTSLKMEENNFVNPFANKTQTNSPQNENLVQNQPTSQINNSFNSNNNESSQTVPSSPMSATPDLNSEPNIETQLQQNETDIPSREEIVEIIDETVEKVIEERWSKLVEKVERVASWKEKQEAHINMIKEDIVSMKEGFEKVEKRLITKIESYDRNIIDVNSEIKALEKVFQKITPTLVNNINELSRITKTIKDNNNNTKEESEIDESSEINN